MDISPYIIFKYNSAEYIMFLRCEYNKNGITDATFMVNILILMKCIIFQVLIFIILGMV